MRKTLALLGIFVFIFGVLPVSAETPVAETAQVQEKVPFLFVQTGDSGSFDGTLLKLNGVGPTVFFSDRPWRINGHVGTQKFVETWALGADSFKQDPPNATLSVLDGAKAVNVVMELSDPVYDGSTLTYKVDVLQGEIPSTFGHASLFLDNSGDAGWGAAGGLLGGLLLGKVMDSSGQQQPAQPQVVYAQPPQPDYSYYRQAPPAPCYCAPCPAQR